jgi:putative peptidoglycan lipid II flippase
VKRIGVDILRAVMVLGASSVIAAGLGLAKNILAAYFFGTSGAMDAYLIALLLPDLAMHLARTGAFHFIPVFASENNRSDASAWRAAGKMFTYWLVLLGTMLTAALLFTKPLLAVVAPGFEGTQLHATVTMTQLLLFMAASVGIARILAMALYAQKRFLAGSLSEAIFQLASTLYLLAFHSLGVSALVWGQILGGLLQLLVVAIALWDHRRQIRPEWDIKSAPVLKMIRLSVPVYIGNLGGKLSTMVTRAFASLLTSGAVSSLQYASLIVETPVTVVGGSLTRATFPFFSQQFADDSMEDMRATVTRAAIGTTILFLPMAVGVFVLADPLVTVLFERGSFDSRSTALTVSALRIFAPAIFALGLNDLLGYVFHSRQEPSRPMVAGLARVGLNIVLCAIMVPQWGHRGIALAFTASAFFKLTVLMFFLKRILPLPQMLSFLHGIWRASWATLAMVATTFFVIRIPAISTGAGSEFTRLIAGCVSGATIYAAALRLFSREEFALYWNLFRNVLGRREPAPHRGEMA